METRSAAGTAKKGGAKGQKGPHQPRNRPLVKSAGTLLMRFSRSAMYKKRATFRKKVPGAKKPAAAAAKPRAVEKQVGGAKNGGKRMVSKRRAPKSYATETRPLRIRSNKQKPFSAHKHTLRKSITPGTVLILLAGRHKAKHVVFLKQLKSGLLLVTGPYLLNGCPLRRVNQRYVIATRTKLDLGKFEVPARVDDKYFARKKLAGDRAQKRSKKDADIFDTKKEVYVVSDQRKEDQKTVDKQVLAAVKRHPAKGQMRSYLKTMFELKKGQLPHKMLF